MDHLSLIFSVTSFIFNIIAGLLIFVWKTGQSQKEKDDEARDKRIDKLDTNTKVEMDKLESKIDKLEANQSVYLVNFVKLEGKIEMILFELKHMNDSRPREKEEP